MGYEQKIKFTVVADTEIAPAAAMALPARGEIERMVANLIRERRRRNAHFPARLFADPAWDILLMLALAESRCQRLPITKLCERLDVPMTTVLRWISTLADEGLIARRDDPTDKRRKFIELSPQAYAAIGAYCTAGEPPLSYAA